MKRAPNDKIKHYLFVEKYTIGGCSIHPGVSIKGEFVITDTHISLKDSTFFKDIPLKYLNEYSPIKYKRKRK